MFSDKSFNEAREDLCRINEPQDNKEFKCFAKKALKSSIRNEKNFFFSYVFNKEIKLRV